MAIRPASTDPIAKYILGLYHKAFIEQENAQVRKLPLVIGISGPQGSGKSTVVAAVAKVLRSKNLNVVDFSLDDVYLTHQDQVALSNANPDNKLVSHRGLPGTHDVKLCLNVFDDLLQQKPTNTPRYDKSAFQGQGDRSTNTFPVKPYYDIVLFEGWCVGFRQLPESVVEQIWKASTGPLSHHSLDHVKFVNRALAQYDQIWSKFHALIQIEALDLNYIYEWRTQQEHDLIQKKGSGMTDAQVRQFVDGYMPAYELYLRTLQQTRSLAITLNRDRKVVNLQEPNKL
ncbi:Tda10p [Sugiyamaella lignohabitans]|uniref:Tda10p n=1 Tax=Sugiyamaella lignohabitans TaxID=796027 RepID=A0A167CHB6_9ASCO|nr:Tda10p [Sugiyamaella lignohabitans]ANB11699.1 Tda10p [Sugiyamaella lignohabitans]